MSIKRNGSSISFAETYSGTQKIEEKISCQVGQTATECTQFTHAKSKAEIYSCENSTKSRVPDVGEVKPKEFNRRGVFDKSRKEGLRWLEAVGRAQAMFKISYLRRGLFKEPVKEGHRRRSTNAPWWGTARADFHTLVEWYHFRLFFQRD